MRGEEGEKGEWELLFPPSFWCDVGGDLQFYNRETSGEDSLKL